MAAERIIYSIYLYYQRLLTFGKCIVMGFVMTQQTILFTIILLESYGKF